MGEQRKAFTLLLILFSSLVSFSEIKVTKAESRTIVVPDDYPTIEAAVVNATDGDTVFVKKGIYDSPINQTLVINKTISLIGEDPETTIIRLYPAYNVTWILTQPFTHYSDAITISANACRILNLKIIAKPGGYISATGNQTQIIGNNLQIGTTTRVIVNGFYCTITDNVISGHVQLNGSFSEVARNSLRAIYVDGSSHIIKDNVCKNIILGWHSKHNANNIISGNIVTSDTRSYSGIELVNSNDNFLCKNQLSGFACSLRLYGSSNNTIVANTIADSLTSITFLVSYNNTFYLNNFIDNKEYSDYIFDRYTDPLIRNATPNCTLSSNFWDNGIEGNYWEDYDGFDNDGDGIGDTLFVIDKNNQDNYPLMQPYNISLFQPPDTTSPEIYIGSPQNETYSIDSVSLNFTVNEETSWMGYSLDRQNNVTVIENTLNLPELSDGSHSLTVYANDTSGNTGTSETIYFTIETPSTTPITIAIVLIAIGGAAFLVYFLKIKKTTKPK